MLVWIYGQRICSDFKKKLKSFNAICYQKSFFNTGNSIKVYQSANKIFIAAQNIGFALR